MVLSLVRHGFVLSLLALTVRADGEAPKEAAAPPAAPAEGPAVPGAPLPEEERDAVRALDKNEKVKTLRPDEVPGEVQEMARLKSKADIKAEITLKSSSGRPIIFKGVIRNGKLIEKLDNKRFVPEESVEDQRCGVRLWWSGDSDGFIFFRYTTIQMLTLTGRLTEEERREIERRLKAKREGKAEAEKQAAALPDGQEDADLEKLSPEALREFLMVRYPYNAGWNHDRLRDLNRQQVLDGKILTREESLFVRYSRLLFLWHFEELKKDREKFKLEPGSDKPAPQGPARQPAPSGASGEPAESGGSVEDGSGEGCGDGESVDPGDEFPSGGGDGGSAPSGDE